MTGPTSLFVTSTALSRLQEILSPHWLTMFLRALAVALHMRRRRRLACLKLEPTLTGVKPGMSSDSRVSQTEWTRGWLTEASASASPTLPRWAGVMKASPAALTDWASCEPVKVRGPGAGQPPGSIGHPET